MSQGFLLDTNVLSEPMREQPAAAVLNWFCENPLASMQTSAITQAKILTGIALLPSGKRRTALALAAEQMFEEIFVALARRPEQVGTPDKHIARPVCWVVRVIARHFKFARLKRRNDIILGLHPDSFRRLGNIQRIRLELRRAG